MLARLRKSQEEREGGFTLIELLVVVIIIGILAAIAIPTFLKQREKAWDKALGSDLRNNATKMEEHFDDKGSYPAATANNTAPALAAADAAYSFKSSETNYATSILSANANGYCLRVESRKSFTDNVKVFNSAVGRPVLPSEAGACTSATYPAAAAG